MQDPNEGISQEGKIVTGADRGRVSPVFEPILAATEDAVCQAAPDASCYLYGSVATGQAIPRESDIDFLTIGLPSPIADTIGEQLSLRFADLVRAVEIAPANDGDFTGIDDSAYGGRVFLRHYCVHLAGPDRHSHLGDFAADARAARGFDGDIASHLARWRNLLSDADDVAELGRRVARKTLLAVAGLVSLHDATWTTDRNTAAQRWAEIHPSLADDLAELIAWSDQSAVANGASLANALDGVVAEIVRSFADMIGLWSGAEAAD